MNATEIAYLEARIEEEFYRKIEEAEATHRRDMEALGVVRGLYERYGDVVEAPEEGPAVSEALTASAEVSELQAAEEDGPDAVVDSGPSAPEHQLDPPDAAGATEEEQRVEAGEPGPEPVEVEAAPTEAEEPAEPEIPEGHKLCKRCGPEVGPKPLSAFGKDVRTADGHARTCSDCMSESRRAGRQKQLDAEERRCASGSRCAEAMGEDGNEPAILRKGYEHHTCTSCRRRAGVAT